MFAGDSPARIEGAHASVTPSRPGYPRRPDGRVQMPSGTDRAAPGDWIAGVITKDVEPVSSLRPKYMSPVRSSSWPWATSLRTIFGHGHRDVHAEEGLGRTREGTP